MSCIDITTIEVESIIGSNINIEQYNSTTIEISTLEAPQLEITHCVSSLSTEFVDPLLQAGSYINLVNSSGLLIISATGLQPSGNYSVVDHQHIISDVSGLQVALDNKQPSGSYAQLIHNHVSSDILDFASSVSGLLPVKDIISGNDISITSVSGIYTINSTVTSINEANSLVTTVFNKTGSPIPKMSVVYISGGQGDTPTIALAVASGELTSSKTYGITAEAISNMSSGKVIVEGALTGLNTDQWNPTAPTGNINGTVLYLSPTISGGITPTKPSAPNHMVSVGTVVRTHQNEGIIEVRIQNGFELQELHNVAVSGATNGQFLQYNSGSGLWVSSSSGNFTTLQVNGTGVSVGGHTHTSSNITDFNSSVSGLLPITNIVAGSGISVASSGSQFTISIVDDSRWAFFLPQAPTGVVGAVGNGSVVLEWASAVSLIPVTNYIVQYSSNSGSTWTTFSAAASTSLSRIVTGLQNGVSYIFRVAAVNGVGQGGWSAASSAVTPSNVVTVDALIVAGGGGGGCGAGGGGGAGGVVSSTSILLTESTSYTVTVGVGGSGSTSTAAKGSNGSNSSFAGVTATGGGGGGSQVSQHNGNQGGSGGGGGGGSGQSSAGGSGTTGQGNAGGAGAGGGPAYGAGGGGGAGAAGGSGTTSTTGSGGNGVSSSISGAAVTYGGGGGGGVYINGGNAAGSGGSGGGGNGSASTGAAGQSGAANTGGGGGGGARSTDGSANSAGGSGGSGVVIISSPKAAAATTGSPTATTSGGRFIYTFTASGSITF